MLATPGLATTAIAAEGGYGRSAAIAFNRASRFTPWTPVFNLTGQPAASVPVGFTDGGLPVGLQIVGRRFAEKTVLRASACFEAARPWADRWPAL